MVQRYPNFQKTVINHLEFIKNCRKIPILLLFEKNIEITNFAKVRYLCRNCGKWSGSLFGPTTVSEIGFVAILLFSRNFSEKINFQFSNLASFLSLLCQILPENFSRPRWFSSSRMTQLLTQSRKCAWVIQLSFGKIVLTHENYTERYWKRREKWCTWVFGSVIRIFKWFFNPG